MPPPGRAEARKKTYKVAVDADEARRKREDNLIEIRKNKREESLLKKRKDGMLNQVDLNHPKAPASMEKKVRLRMIYVL